MPQTSKKTSKDARDADILVELDRLRHWCVTGRRTAAALELSAWARNANCPDAVRLLWASVLIQRSENILALQTLEASTTQSEPVRRMRVALCVRAGRWTEAEKIAVTLGSGTLRADLGIDAVLAADPASANGESEAGADRGSSRDDAGGDEVESPERIAEALHIRCDLVPMLVSGARAAPKAPRLTRLRDGLVLVYRALEHSGRRDDLLVVATAVSELSMMLGDEPAAALWARTGLQFNRTSATLAIVLSWLDDDLSGGDDAVTVLRRVAAAHPTYRDIAAALRRREAGRGAVALGKAA
jgi:hypothetical protein